MLNEAESPLGPEEATQGDPATSPDGRSEPCLSASCLAGARHDLSPTAADLVGALGQQETDEEAGIGRMIAGEVARALSAQVAGGQLSQRKSSQGSSSQGSSREPGRAGRQPRWWRKS